MTTEENDDMSARSLENHDRKFSNEEYENTQ